MSEKMLELAARKRLLLMRSALLRLQLRQQLDGSVRSGLGWVDFGVRAATSAPVRSALFGLALSRLGHNRVARAIAIASKALLFAKITGVALDIRRGLQCQRPPALPPGRDD